MEPRRKAVRKVVKKHTKKILTIARNMKASEMSAEEIEKMTGLPKD